MTEPVTNQRAPRFVKNPSGYHSHGKTHKEKVYNFGVHIKQFGWSGKWDEDPDSKILKAILIRGTAERIEIEWPANQWWPDVWYSYAGEMMKCRNISQAAKIASEKPDPDRMRRATRRKRVGVGYRSGASGTSATGDARGSEPASEEDLADLISSLSTTLPFDRESTPDEIKAIIKTKRNPTILWLNRLTGNVEQDYIKTWSRHLKVTKTKQNKTVIHFVGADRFHAVYVDSVISLG